ncbi:hypothetical protein GE21DRAFT_5328 [Neurospora crassa]|uniref:Uncharacterized protein n=1 Tax=Neurospora crassa (strain ATCC 24698 / 74-OR23-1A / CBS 708.71 / DSM 1257 / FGSC 987) TaxID=367110 RepID=Q7S064_NEUCR|nr:hypothetical protein NCU04881 [Neurospora crassa OR74A]EAA28686.2 hypothetical protein NCU04881 [Neurospora crassa OR74A]KHE81913.1 hypothetical protein GE21DRAFT_5328 [Neurospora crassa]|eukprot:XP_957922.2 hypothetical protein NCU04881 [Neurospora crassa OR74A]
MSFTNFHRRRDKGGPQAERKHHFGFRKSFHKFMGWTNSEPTEHSPCNSVAPSSLSEEYTAVSEDITITSTPETLWDRAYDALRSSNDAAKSGLIAEYEGRVLQAFAPKMSGSTVEPAEAHSKSLLGQTPTFKAVLDRAIEDALTQAQQKSLARSSVDKAGKLMLALQNFISEAVKASPEASLAWAGVCLVLPLLTQPAIADEAQRNGFSYVTSCIAFWTTLERQLANTMIWTESVQDEFITLYQHLLEFQVRTVLRYYQGGFARFVQDVSSNVWDQLITAIKDQERLLHQDLQQYHNVHQTLTSDLLKQNSDKYLESNAKVLQALQDVQHLVRKDTEDKLEEKEKKCLRLFRLTNSQRDVTYEWYKSRVEERVQGTCVWAVEHENFQDWLERKSGPLLITADPGCGKSVLSKYLIDQYLPQRCPTATVCYFFFKDGDQSTVKQALCALLHQLFGQKPELIKHALEEHVRNGDGLIGTTSSLWRVFKDATQDERAGTIIILLDALDECEPDEFKLLVHNLIQAGENPVKFLLTSRPYGDVISSFKYGDMLQRFPRVLIPGEKEDQSDQISTEINHVIQVRVEQFVHKYGLKNQLRDTLWAELNKTKHRTYLWVYLVFDHLETLVTSDALKRTPQGFKTAMEKLPRTVEDAYERILNRARGVLRTILRRVLCVMLAAQRPLTLSEMQIVVNMEPHIKSVKELDLEDEEDFSKRLRTICGLFVSIHQRKVYFLHQTAREFLHAKTELSTAPESWRASIRENQAHGELARICVQTFHVAVVLGCTGLVQHLLREIRAEEINTGYNALETTPLALAARHGHRNVMQLLIAAGARVDVGWDGRTPLYEAVDAKHSECVAILLNYGASVDFLDADYGRTLLHVAVGRRNAEIGKMLADRGMDVNAIDFAGNTALMEYMHVWEWENDGIEFATVLIEKGARLDMANKYGETALMQAVSTRRWALAKLLIEKGADPNLQDGQGESALHMILYYNEDEVAAVSLAKTLIDKCLHLDAQNYDGKTPLHNAAEKGLVKLVRLLLESGADTEATDHQGNRPLFLAVMSLNPQAVEMLLKFGAKVEDAGGSHSILEKATELVEDNTYAANSIISEYESFKQRTSRFITGPNDWTRITEDTLNMTRLIDGWNSERAKRSLATYQMLRRAVAHTSIDKLDEHEAGRLLQNMDQLLEDAKPMLKVNLPLAYGCRRPMR